MLLTATFEPVDQVLNHSPQCESATVSESARHSPNLSTSRLDGKTTRLDQSFGYMIVLIKARIASKPPVELVTMAIETADQL